MRTRPAAALLLTVIAAAVSAQESVEESYRPGFSVCAAYYFLAARGHGVKDYDALYTAGEFSLNEAIRLYGRAAANGEMERASGIMMDEIDRDWRKVHVIDVKYGGSCEILLRDAHFDYR